MKHKVAIPSTSTGATSMNTGKTSGPTKNTRGKEKNTVFELLSSI